MAEQVLVQLLATSQGGEHYRWGRINDQGQWAERPQSGDESTLLAELAEQSLPAILVIPGERVVTQQVEYSEKEKRHLRQLLPYQLEETVIGDVEDLHFAVGTMAAGIATVAYTDDEWFGGLIQRMRESNLNIQRCVTDFQLLSVGLEQWVLWLTGERVLGHHSSGIGFSITRQFAEPLLAQLLASLSPEATEDEAADTDARETLADDLQIALYGDNKAALDYLYEQLPEAAKLNVTEKFEGAPALSLASIEGVNLCQGPYAKRLPINQWWQAWRSVAALALVAVAGFFAVTLLDVYQLKDQQAQNQQAIEQSFRTAIPRGRMTGDPVRQLRSKLGKSDQPTQNSQAVYLLSMVAPVIKERNIELTTLAYSNSDNRLQINVEADSFGAIEELRKQLSDQGLVAELQNSQGSGDKHQARLRITAGGRS